MAKGKSNSTNSRGIGEGYDRSRETGRLTAIDLRGFLLFLFPFKQNYIYIPLILVMFYKSKYCS